MATAAQIAANRRNAQHSTGPRTGEGKAAVRLNSLTHGLRAQEVLLPDEDPAVFEELRESFQQQFNPEGPPSCSASKRCCSVSGATAVSAASKPIYTVISIQPKLKPKK